MTNDSSSLPVVTDNDFEEQAGVLKVAGVANKARFVWRQTLQRDVGIDGQIEHVNDQGQATGAMILVQIKSGVSYFDGEKDGFVPFSPPFKHSNYWERAAAPVILVLHHEASDRTLWVDARDSLRREPGKIRVPVTNVLDTAGLRSAMGPTPDAPINLSSLAGEMLARSSSGFGVNVDYLDLFVYGLVDAFGELYFGIDLVSDIASTKAERAGAPGFGLGAAEYDFIHEYVRFLVSQDLARVSYDDFFRAWEHRQLVGRFLAPLTTRGAALARHLSSLESAQPQPRRIWAIQDKFFSGVMPMEHERRFEAVEELKVIVRTIQEQGAT